MGLAAAKLMGKDHFIIISGRSLKKLESAVQELTEEGIEAEAFACDVAEVHSVMQRKKGRLQPLSMLPECLLIWGRRNR